MFIGAAHGGADEEKVTKPKAVQKLKNIEAVEGWKVQFDVRMKCYPRPVVEWYRGKTKIRSGGRYQITKMEDEGLYSLIISDVQLDDTGSYKCVASNIAGDATSRAELVVRDKKFAPTFSEQDYRGPVTVSEGEELKLRVTCKAKPLPDISWYKDGIRLDETRRINMRSFGDSHYLVIPATELNDTGLFKCEATTDLGTSFQTFDVQITGILNF